MPINSYKEDEKAAEASKLQTLGRLFSYLLNISFQYSAFY